MEDTKLPLSMDGTNTHVHGRQRSLFDYFNLDIFNNLPTIKDSWIPYLKPYRGKVPNRMTAFDEALTKGDTECIVHFYEDDRRFLRLFRHPEKYLDFLRHCALVIEPDLSQYCDMAYPIRQAHAYLNRAMAVYMQQLGVRVIPNIAWSHRDSYDIARCGVPKNAVVAVNCTGIIKHSASLYRWREGYKHVVLPLQPSTIIRYGNRIEGELDNISVYFENKNLKYLRNGSKR